MSQGYGATSSGNVRVDPDALTGAARRFDLVGEALDADAAAVHAWPPAAGFDSAAAAADLDAALVTGLRDRVGRAQALADGLRSTAATWRTHDDAAAAALTG